MKIVAAVFAACMAAQQVSAFAPVASSRGIASCTRIFSEPEKKEEEGGLDLDLGEMFEMWVTLGKKGFHRSLQGECMKNVV